MLDTNNAAREDADGQEPKKRKRVRIATSETQRTPYRSSDVSRAKTPEGTATEYSPRERRPSYPDSNRGSNPYSNNRNDNRTDNRNYRSSDNRSDSGNYRGGNDNRSANRDYRNDNNRGGGYNNANDRGYNDRGRDGNYNSRNNYNPAYNQSSNYNRGTNDGYRGPQVRPNDNYNKPRFNKPKEISRTKRLLKPVKYKETFDPEKEVRLNKYLANAGVCSRREADSFITAGSVKVNGVVTTELGSKVTYADEIMFNDKVVSPESKVYVLLNKPKNCVTTSDDPENRTTVMDLVKNACAERIYPVGRLDRNTTGVLLLTNDGDLASKLMHPKFKKKKIYQVTLDRPVAVEDMQTIADGVELDDGEIHADSIAYVSEDKLNEVGIEIHSGRNRVVRRIFEKLNYKILKLDRVYFSGLTKKNVPRGKWRYLSPEEVNMLRMGAFE